MNMTVLMGKMERWTEKLAEKDYLDFSLAEQKEMKKDYIQAEEQAKGYGVGAECTLVLKAFVQAVGDMEGFFFETEQA